jgi:hypothetical protein
MRNLVILIVGLLVPAICCAAPLGYGGINLGSSRKAAERSRKDVDCRDYPECEFNDTINGKMVLVKLRFEKGKLVQINLVFLTDDFPAIKSALIKKRGNPSKVKQVASPDAPGVKRDYQELIWTLKDGSITADEYAIFADDLRLGVVRILAKGVAPLELLQE